MYISMLAQELIWNRLKRDAIINNKISSVLNIKEIFEDEIEIVLYGKDILERIDEIFEDTSQYKYIKIWCI